MKSMRAEEKKRNDQSLADLKQRWVLLIVTVLYVRVSVLLYAQTGADDSG